MKNQIILLLILVVSLSLTAKERNLTFIVQTGTSLGLGGYNVQEWGDIGSSTRIETEYLPGFIISNLQIGLGKELSSQLYMAFMVGGWANEDFSRYAVTTASVYGQYRLNEKDLAPLISLQTGLFLEDFPEAFLGLLVNPSIGMDIKKTSALNWHVSLGYLLTYWGNNSTDPGNSNYLNIDEDMRHSISLNAAILF